MQSQNKTKKQQLVIETNRRLQEVAQKLFMAKQELEKKNAELKIAEEREKHRKEELEHELSALKRLAGTRVNEEVDSVPKRKITRSIAEDLSLRYINFLESYVRTKDLDKEESLVEEFCQDLIEYGITPKGIVGIHLKSVPQVNTIGDLETKRVTFESRMVLLKIMTQYASLLLKERRP